MLQKNKSKRIALIKYGLSVPLFILMLILSSASVNNSKTVAAINKTAQNILSTPASPQAIESKLQLNKLSASLKLLTKQEIISAAEDTYTDQNRDDMQLTAVSSNLPAITNSNNTGAPVVSKLIERQPEFPGGIEKFYEILRNNLHYPEEMRTSRIEGKVFVQFVVEKDGSVTEFKTLRAPGYGSEEETKRVISSMPKWIPGYQNGLPISVVINIPIEFRLVNPTQSDTASVHANAPGNTKYITKVATQQPTQNAFKGLLSSLSTATNHFIASLKTDKKKSL